MAEKIKVLIVDDSDLTRNILKTILGKSSAIQVVGLAENGKKAIEQTLKLRPDAIVMDVCMPVMDGLEATQHIMAYCPTPILILSSYLDKGGIYTTFNALAAGAVDIMEKPSVTPNSSWDAINDALTRKVMLISQANVVTHVKGKMKKIVMPKESVLFPKPNKHEIVGIGASTGGPSVVMQILKSLPPDYPYGIVIVQHMAEGFTKNFADWLGNAARIKVKLAEEGERIEKGKALVAPDGFHTIVRGKRTIGLVSGVPVNSVRPSADVLFQSIADVYGASAVGVLLTGMGADGAEGLKQIKDRGGITIAQSEESCAVFGMPKVAIEKGAAIQVLPIDGIIHAMNRLQNSDSRPKNLDV